MCLKPIKIRNPSSVISRNGGQKGYIEVPCGYCADCMKSQRLAWRFRSYHHVQNCLKTGGFVYFDTLTYREDCVPHLSHYVDYEQINNSIIANYNKQVKLFGASVPHPNLMSDVYVFDNSHWRNFLKNLRRQLDYHYNGVKFTYFLTSEYGTAENYTHRPHYHVLFFLNDKTLISNYEFSSLVSKCWTYGRTDGLPYQERLYVDEHTYSSPDDDCMKLCNYVSKYVTKDSTFQKEINNRLSVLKKHLDDEQFKRVKRQVSMFHRQSQGYGRSFLDTLTEDEADSLLKENVVRIVDADKIVCTLPLPIYYKRALYYVLKRDDEGKYYWQPNERGLQFLRHSFERNINNLEVQLYNKYINFDNHTQQKIFSLLRGRTLHDVALYSIIYKDRIRPLYSNPYTLRYEETLPNYVNHILNCAFVHDDPYNDVLHRDIDNNTIYVPIYRCTLFNNTFDYIDYDKFLKQHIISQDSCSDFKHFDEVLALFRASSCDKNNLIQITFNFIEELEQKFKHYLQYGY